MNLPEFLPLARARQAANEGRYLIALDQDGTVVGRAQFDCPNDEYFTIGAATPAVKMPNGEAYRIGRVETLELKNAAYGRANLLDIAEELADAANISLLTHGRLIDAGEGSIEITDAMLEFGASLGLAWEALERLDRLVPDFIKHDLYPVERILPDAS